MMRKQRQKKQNKGAVLALMVIVVLLLSMTSLALIRVGTAARLRTVKNDLLTAARFAADAGVERVVYQMNQNLAAGTWSVGDVPTFLEEPLPGANADYTVTFEGDLDSGYQLTSAGRSGDRTRTVRATVALTSPVSKEFAVFGKSKINLKSNSTVGGFNSADAFDTDVRARIGSLSSSKNAINLNNNVTLDGDIYTVPDGDADRIVDAHSGADIDGQIFSLPSYYDLPPVSAPVYVASQGSISGEAITLSASNSGKYSEITLTNNGTLSIEGDLTLYITGDVVLKKNAEIRVTEHSTLTLYFDGNIEGKNSSGFNNLTGVPGKLLLYGTGSNQSINLKNNSDLYAVIYAPDAKMTVHNSVNAYGAFVVDEFELKNSANIFYDKALRQVDEDDELVRFAVTRWEEL